MGLMVWVVVLVLVVAVAGLGCWVLSLSQRIHALEELAGPGLLQNKR